MEATEARNLLHKFGPNEIERQTRPPVWKLLLEQFRSPLVLLLIAAVLLSAFLGEWVEAAAIATILLLNALIGFMQEYSAENAIEALQGLTAPRATVQRDGKKQSIPAKEVVPGDLLFLEAGDVVAADAHLQKTSGLQVNEALLTGESLPVHKEGQVKVFSGTTVVSGTGTAQVSETGMRTELGKIAKLITHAEEAPTPLQVQLNEVSKRLLIVCLVVAAVTLVVGLQKQTPWIDLVIFAISLAVAAVPEGLPAIVTMALALGIRRMAARHALIRKLPSIETLGCVSVICTDKTGTLTTGNMRVIKLAGPDEIRILKFAAACCDPQVENGLGDPTEAAILQAAAERGVHLSEIEKQNPRVQEFPFDSNRKRMSILREDGVLYVKGAYDRIIEHCILSEEEKRRIHEAHDQMTAKGLRALAVAEGSGTDETQLKWVGLIGLADPPRPEAIEAIRKARDAGILPIMITGDHRSTALAIAKELQFFEDEANPEERVHARATPEDKLKLVREWKSRHQVVAMTGDGVNDAPALREAHVGIAMGRAGTEVTRQTADIVLADDNFATIIAAIEEGRNVYRNIKKAILFLLAGNLGEVVIVLSAAITGMPMPFLAIHLLWINLVTDGLPALALIADPASPDVMKQSPRPIHQPLLGKSEWIQVCWIGLAEALLITVFYRLTLQSQGLETARNYAFTTLVFSQMFRSFGARSTQKTLWQVGAFGNLWLMAVVAFTASMQLGLHYLPLAQSLFGLRPLTLEEILRCVSLALIPITLIELRKLVFGRFKS